ncbi:hypothetical protein [Aggregatilinea lenta]|uniref:hypothetical protein n=1 Tax=Aggregatilinea lenta TaxID=913108 RepID=UPI0013C2F0A5|nr:hypothetical protein [Aggregatilinea lenta]
MEQEPGVPRRWIAVVAGIAAFILVLVVLRQLLADGDGITAQFKDNRTWLEFAWTDNPVNADAVVQLGERLGDGEINRVYLEASAWRTDGTLIEGQHAQAFVDALRQGQPDLEVLLWLRMSIDQIADANQQAEAVALADKAVHQWGLEGIQLNAIAVPNGSNGYVSLVRDLRTAIGDDALLSITVPPDRVPSDPDVPMTAGSDPDLTWDLNYKQRIGLLLPDELAIMAHASGLQTSDDYATWVGYQLSSYVSALSELENPVGLVIVVPTYDAAPEHDPAVETVSAAISGVERGANASAQNKQQLLGIGLYEYKTTDSREWAVYREKWLGKKSD